MDQILAMMHSSSKRENGFSSETFLPKTAVLITYLMMHALAILRINQTLKVLEWTQVLHMYLRIIFGIEIVNPYHQP
jgi:hypothetical protein